ncbi:MAG: hypothetical protein QXF01_01950 [Candidatus Micrarchaeaceae archaeon]
MPQRVYSCSADEAQALKKLLEYDPYLDKNMSEEQLAKLKKDEDANVIFARQDYLLKDGISLSQDREKYYLYLNANEEFMERAEKKLKANIKSIARVDPDTESQIIEDIESERHASEQGLGSIFG